MKKKILLASGSSALMATLIASSSLIFSSNAETVLKASGVAGYAGLLAIALFFVGWAFPKE